MYQIGSLILIKRPRTGAITTVTFFAHQQGIIQWVWLGYLLKIWWRRRQRFYFTGQPCIIKANFCCIKWNAIVSFVLRSFQRSEVLFKLIAWRTLNFIISNTLFEKFVQYLSGLIASPYFLDHNNSFFLLLLLCNTSFWFLNFISSLIYLYWSKIPVTSSSRRKHYLLTTCDIHKLLSICKFQLFKTLYTALQFRLTHCRWNLFNGFMFRLWIYGWFTFLIWFIL